MSCKLEIEFLGISVMFERTSYFAKRILFFSCSFSVVIMDQLSETHLSYKCGHNLIFVPFSGFSHLNMFW